MGGLRTAWPWRALLLLAACGFLFASQRLHRYPRVAAQVEMQVALPLFVQVGLAGGDRYLAADIATVRALIVATGRMDADGFAILARVQNDASWLNPAHEDNYYLATAILPWNQEVAAAQTILRRATSARPFDYQPPFYYAFNQAHFLGDVVGASEWLAQAAPALPDENERLQMQNLAARMMDRAADLNLAISVVESMARQARRGDFKRYLEVRVERLRTLKTLRVAAEQYRLQKHAVPTRFEQLVEAGYLSEMPRDPFGFGYAFEPNGNVVIRNAPQK